jgi:hypothetical protein
MSEGMAEPARSWADADGAAGVAHGSPAQEGVIKVAAYSSAPTGIVSLALILWRPRMPNVCGQTS